MLDKEGCAGQIRIEVENAIFGGGFIKSAIKGGVQKREKTPGKRRLSDHRG
ncbi:hypothetical protein PP175_23270 [Aneurinibacillus sp. Ricciae_BoGa-3]|uniref:hypothetical protein n=1 Tax=Aneurinibacillus sp. Ricciae_BoGa-3 TaxID=3022697 RepID=UPI00234210EE|nr:hypothetical protein [Aneurinibacillus sp. Ricciae_BoGa-3]WCK54174.1 hypothetical protein PP175_23270 [Aneurinibacillus sp. Ricciae_BoGa-3]